MTGGYQPEPGSPPQLPTTGSGVDERLAALFDAIRREVEMLRQLSEIERKAGYTQTAWQLIRDVAFRLDQQLAVAERVERVDQALAVSSRARWN